MAEKKVIPADPALVGKKIYLRPVTPEDMASIHLWRVLTEQQTLSSRPTLFMTPTEAAERFKKTDDKNPYNQRFAVVRIEGDLVVGSIHVFDHNPLNRSAEYGAIVDPDHQKQGYATEALSLMTRFLFRHRGLNKVHAQTASFNKNAVKLLEGLGFKRDAVLRDHYFHNGEFHAGYIYSLLAFEFE